VLAIDRSNCRVALNDAIGSGYFSALVVGDIALERFALGVFSFCIAG